MTYLNIKSVSNLIFNSHEEKNRSILLRSIFFDIFGLFNEVKNWCWKSTVFEFQYTIWGWSLSMTSIYFANFRSMFAIQQKLNVDVSKLNLIFDLSFKSNLYSKSQLCFGHNSSDCPQIVLMKIKKKSWILLIMRCASPKVYTKCLSVSVKISCRRWINCA